MLALDFWPLTTHPFGDGASLTAGIIFTGTRARTREAASASARSLDEEQWYPPERPSQGDPGHHYRRYHHQHCRSYRLSLARPSTGTPRLTPDVVLALKLSPQKSSARPVQLSIPRPSPLPPTMALEARCSRAASTSEPPLSHHHAQCRRYPLEKAPPRGCRGQESVVRVL